MVTTVTPNGIKKYNFLWTYKNPQRKGAISTGEIEAASISMAKAQLRRRGMEAEYLVVKKEARGVFAPPVKIEDILIFLRQLSTLQNAGVSTMEGMQMQLLTAKKQSMRDMVKAMIKQLNEGNQLSDALELFPKWFDHVSISLIRAGEQGGVLDTVLKNIADYKEKDHSIKKKIRSALIYPAVTTTVMIVVVTILMIAVIPVFSHLYSSFGSQLPYLTQIVVNLSDWMKNNVVLLIAVPIGVIATSIYFYKRSPKFRWIADRVTLRIPIMGALLIKGATARFMKTLALLQGAGVPVQMAMDTLSHVSGNTVIDTGIAKATRNVIAGGTIAEGMQETALPKLAVQMLAIGEKTGNIELLAQKSGEFYENEVDEMVARMSTLLEPFIMIFLGIIVGTLVISMFLPILDMGQAILSGSQ